MDVRGERPYNERIQSFGRRDRVPLELKATINLPKTAFPMKANLPQNEPKMLERWEQRGIYERIRKAESIAVVGWVENPDHYPVSAKRHTRNSMRRLTGTSRGLAITSSPITRPIAAPTPNTGVRMRRTSICPNR